MTATVYTAKLTRPAVGAREYHATISWDKHSINQLTATIGKMIGHELHVVCQWHRYQNNRDNERHLVRRIRQWADDEWLDITEEQFTDLSLTKK